MKKKELTLYIGWLYPELMSTYGDRGNIICLEKRCQWRKVAVKVISLGLNCSENLVKNCDLIIGGGAQDRQQELAVKDLLQKKKVYREIFERGIPGLFVCGSPQLLGHYYMTGEGKKLPGLGIFDFVTRHFGHDKPRCIGNTASAIISLDLADYRPKKAITFLPKSFFGKTLVGFENHGGRTYLGENCRPLAKVLKGYGNNGEDGYEGAIYKNVIACYYHGPLLPKNPHLADWLIAKALEVKYKRKIKLEPLDDSLEWQAHYLMLKKMGIC